jgi:hypothetical protein
MQFLNGKFKRPSIINGSGEDFLYMHREKLFHYRKLMQEAGQEPIVWMEIPPPGETGQEVPPAWPIPKAAWLERRVAALKTDDFYWSRMRWWDRQFKDPTYLATLTLGELGSLLEYSVHNDTHIRWSAQPRDPDTDAPLPDPYGRPDADYGEKWDNPKYDTLFEFYSSHVNPYFWRLHGWVDDRIDDWFEAHERVHPGEVAAQPHGAIPWFKTGKWVRVADPWVWPQSFAQNSDPHDGGGHGGGDPGGGGHDIPSAERDRRIKSMQQALNIVHELDALGPAGAGEQSSFSMNF